MLYQWHGWIVWIPLRSIMWATVYGYLVVWPINWSSRNKLALFSDLSESISSVRCLSRRFLLAWRGRRPKTHHDLSWHVLLILHDREITRSLFYLYSRPSCHTFWHFDWWHSPSWYSQATRLGTFLNQFDMSSVASLFVAECLALFSFCLLLFVGFSQASDQMPPEAYIAT